MGNTPEHVETVVVGSGFGGSVAAYRLAEAGRSVFLLERGRPYPPGSFPRSPREMGRAFWDPRAGLYGLFDVWSFGGFDSLVSAGLGGGSLIYANVLLRKDEDWFVHHEPLPRGGYESWPVARADLEDHYDAVERMLNPAPYPIHAPAFSDTPKTLAMREAARARGLDWQLPPLAVSFAPRPEAEPAVGAPIEPAPYGNVHGAAHGSGRRTCRLSGACDIGCNNGAKSTLDHTYLSAAAHHGAEIRTLCEVRGFRPREGGGYQVNYVHHDPDVAEQRRGAPKPPVRQVSCDRLVLGAGTYGTTHLLLRNSSALPGLSPALGTRFSGNGDLLTFLLPADSHPRVFDASHGPVITSAIKVDGGDGRGYYLEDGGYPGFVDWLAESADLPAQVARVAEFALRWLIDRVRQSGDTNLSKEVSRLLGDGSLSAGSLPLLGMGRDAPDGVMRLRGGRLHVDWTTRTSAEYFAAVRETMREVAAALGTDFLDNPMWFFRRVITVHPLGGAPMGHTPAEGVCDSYGEVFNHPGLYVSDGAAMPGPVGANPSLTIAAHGDRMATHILDRAGSRSLSKEKL